jgi:hypothetical protein
MQARTFKAELHLDPIRSVPFIRQLRLIPSDGGRDTGVDGILEITTPRAKYRLALFVKRSHLDRGVVNAMIGKIRGAKKVEGVAQHGAIILAPYVATPTARNLIEAGISFADEVGNIHLVLGNNYNWTVIGERQSPKGPESERITHTAVQLLFQLATTPESATWTVRDLANAAGIGKSKAAQLRAQFVHERLLIPRGTDGQLEITPALKDSLISSYSRILRPKIFLGRYRHVDKTTEAFLNRFPREADELKIGYALTGGPAADALLHTYRTPDVPMFIEANDSATLRHFRLLPDRQGPVTLLRSFAPLVYWREIQGKTVAPPWLIYAELLTSFDGRDREVAEELRQKLLQ